MNNSLWSNNIPKMAVLTKKLIKKVIPPNAGLTTVVHLTILLSFSLIPKVLENLSSIVLTTNPKSVILTKNSAYTKKVYSKLLITKMVIQKN